MAKLRRVYHHYTLWEDAAHGMWRRNTSGEERADYRRKAASLMTNAEAFYEAMAQVTREWKYACEANFTAWSVNRQAWIGHAGCCLATGSPEDVTREAWHLLSKEQQDAANRAADRAIAEWETRYVEALSAKA